MGKTADASNVALFGELAADWWDPNGRSKLLHRINPARLAFLHAELVDHFGRDPHARAPLSGLTALDIGCGAGLVTEPLARMGATTTGLDASDRLIAVAKEHAAGQQLDIAYQSGEIAAFAEGCHALFDIITCLEVVEHVEDRDAFLATIRRLLKPEGILVFSTPNRTLRSWAVLIAGAEYLTRAIPRGGHDWHRFLTPDALSAALARAGLNVNTLRGLSWSPARGFVINDDLSINYIGTAVPV